MNLPPDHPDSGWVRVDLLAMSEAEIDAYIEESVRAAMAEVYGHVDRLGWAGTTAALVASLAQIEQQVREHTRRSLASVKQRLLH